MYKELVSGTKIGPDNAIVFANNALVNTQVNVDVTPDISTIPYPKTRSLLLVYNPSTITDLTIKIFAKETAFGGDVRYCLIDTVSIPKSQSITGTTVNAYEKIFEGLFSGSSVRLVVSNDTALGAAEGFTAYARLREV
jgi:hypothetical protein